MKSYRLHQLFAVIIVGLLAACSVIGTQNSVSRDDAGNLRGCRSSAGEYGLPKSVFSVTVAENRIPSHLSRGDPTSTIIQPLDHSVVRSSGQTFCLDFLNSFTSNDQLVIEKEGSSGLLTKISVNTDDQLDEAISDVFDGLANITARANGNTVPEDQIRFTDNFDPMSEADLKILNSRLRDFGYCIIVVPHNARVNTFEEKVAKFCRNRLSASAFSSLAVTTSGGPSEFNTLPEGYRHSVLYHPTLTADVFTLHQPNRQRPHNWQIAEKQVYTLVDTSTILGLDIRRAIFSTRSTELTFQKGVLTTVFVEKGSQVTEFVKIPLSIAKAVIRLPAQIISIKVGERNSATDLIKAQQDLITQVEALKAAREANQTAQDNTSAQSRSTAGFFSSGAINQCVASCQAIGNDNATCTQSCSCQASQCVPGDTACIAACGG